MRTEYRLLTSTGKPGRQSTLRGLNGQTTISQGVKGQDGGDSANTPPDSGQAPAKIRRHTQEDPLSNAAEKDSRFTQPPVPATRDNFAALRRRAREAEKSTTLNF